MTPNTLMLSLIARQSLEAELVDQLSELADYPLFLVSNLRGHNDTHHGLSVAEQVEGTAPLIRLMEWTLKEGGFILWEAPTDF